MLVILTLGVGFIAKTSFTVIGFIKTGIRLHSFLQCVHSFTWMACSRTAMVFS